MLWRLASEASFKYTKGVTCLYQLYSQLPRKENICTFCMITHRHVSNHSHAAAGTLGNILYLLAKAGQYRLTWYLGEDRGAALAHVPVGPHTGEGGGCRTMPARSLHSVVHLHSDAVQWDLKLFPGWAIRKENVMAVFRIFELVFEMCLLS